MQHSIQRTLGQSRDPVRRTRACSPTVVLEQLLDRIRSISQDTHALNRSCGVEMATSSTPSAARKAAVRLRAEQARMQGFSQTRAQRPTLKWSRTQRRRRRSQKRACSDTIEESSSSADEADGRRKRARFCKESSPFSLIHIQTTTSLHLYITTSTWYHERASIHCSVTHSLRLKSGKSHDSCQPSPALALLNNLGHGGNARVRFGEAQNPGPATHDRDWTAAQQRIASHGRINEAGDSVLGSQDSVTR